MNILQCTGYVKDRYPIYVSTDADFSDLPALLPVSQKRIVIIDEKLKQLFPHVLGLLTQNETHIFPIGATEDNKSLKGLETLFDAIFDLKPSRDDIIIAIGGGLVTNIGGLAGSLIMRGIRFYYIPTTLTSQIDASLGSKQAVNFRDAKNWLGTYNDPEFCYVNPYFLDTIPKRAFNSQVIEGIKLCLATDQALFTATFKQLENLYSAPLEQRIDFIEKMIAAKLAVLAKDLLEENYGMSMLYGHTIGHAIEMLDHEHISHGEGVGIGMLAAARISHALGLADQHLIDIHMEVLDRLGLPTKIPPHITPAHILEKLSYNKKNYGGKIHFVLLKGIGQMADHAGDYFTIVPPAVISAVLEESY